MYQQFYLYYKILNNIAKILKSEKELKALDNTLNHLKGWNSKYWDSFLNKVINNKLIK